jgi:hypothetical protein
VSFTTNEKESMVVVVERGAIGSEVGVVVVANSGSKSIGKPMVGGGEQTLITHHYIMCRLIWKSLCKHIETHVNPTLSNLIPLCIFIVNTKSKN